MIVGFLYFTPIQRMENENALLLFELGTIYIHKNEIRLSKDKKRSVQFTK